MKQSPYAQHAKFTTKPGMRDELVQLLKQETAETLKHTPECIYYLISVTEESDVVWLFELWESKQAKDAVLNPEEGQRVTKLLMPLIVSITDRTGMTVVGGKGA